MMPPGPRQEVVEATRNRNPKEPAPSEQMAIQVPSERDGETTLVSTKLPNNPLVGISYAATSNLSGLVSSPQPGCFHHLNTPPLPYWYWYW
jgi:hypothetical protein